MTMINGYEQSDREEKIDILNLESLEERAEEIIPAGGFGYIAGDSEDEWTLKQNRMAFHHRQIAPKALSGIEKPELNTEIFGIPLSTPIMMAPAAAQGLAHSQGEKDTARACGRWWTNGPKYLFISFYC